MFVEQGNENWLTLYSSTGGSNLAAYAAMTARNLGIIKAACPNTRIKYVVNQQHQNSGVLGVTTVGEPNTNQYYGDVAPYYYSSQPTGLTISAYLSQAFADADRQVGYLTTDFIGLCGGAGGCSQQPAIYEEKINNDCGGASSVEGYRVAGGWGQAGLLGSMMIRAMAQPIRCRMGLPLRNLSSLAAFVAGPPSDFVDLGNRP
jgi:hypothetical protein